MRGLALAIEDHVLHIVSLQLVVEVVGLDAGLALVGGRAVGKPVLAIGAVEGSVRIGHGNTQCAVLHIEAVGAVLLPGSGVYGIDLVRSGAEQVVIRAHGLDRLRVALRQSPAQRELPSRNEIFFMIFVRMFLVSAVLFGAAR